MTSEELRMFEKEKYSREEEVGWHSEGRRWTMGWAVPCRGQEPPRRSVGEDPLREGSVVRFPRLTVVSVEIVWESKEEQEDSLRSCTGRPHKRRDVCQDLTGAVVCLPSNSTTLSTLVPTPSWRNGRLALCQPVTSCVSALTDGALISSAPHGFCWPICFFTHLASPCLSVAGVACCRTLSFGFKPSSRAALLGVTVITEGEHGCWVGPVSWWVASHSWNSPSEEDSGLGSLWTF